jgi:hypothetical protein
MRNIVTALTALALAISPLTAKADEVAQCLDRVSACEDALDSADQAINKQAELIDELAAQNRRLQEAVNYQTSELSKERAWYRDPSFTLPVSFAAGALLGAFIVNGAKKN